MRGREGGEVCDTSSMRGEITTCGERLTAQRIGGFCVTSIFVPGGNAAPRRMFRDGPR